jgi:hypothetical protein
VDDVEKRKFLTLPGLELLPIGGPVRREILRTVSNTGIYCSSDKFGTVYVV